MLQARRVLSAVIVAQLALLSLTTAGADELQALRIRYYGDISCSHCDTFVSAEAPALEQLFGVRLEIEAFDIMRADRMQEAQELLAEYGQEYRVFPVMFIGNNAYQGNSAISEALPQEIEYFLRYGEHPGVSALSDALPRGETVRESAPFTDAATEAQQAGPVLLYFWAEGCPACARAAPLLDELEQRLPELTVERYEVSTDQEALTRFRELSREFGITAAGVPSFFLDEYSWVGIGPATIGQIEVVAHELLLRQEHAGADALPRPVQSSELVLPVFGSVSLDTLPAFAVTAVIAAVDGFNPCSLWVLTFLVGLIVRTGSRRRTLAVGLTFLLVTASVYGLFMLGVFSVLAVAAELTLVRLFIGLLAIAMGLINMKDFFAFKWGISLTIPERFQPLIARRGREIFEQRGAVLPMLGATVVFALGISVVELPCTAGFPVIWSQYVAGLGVASSTFAALFSLYLFIYLSLELIVVVVAVVLMQRLNFGESQARSIKLIGGAVMVALGVAYFGFPEATHSFLGVGLIFGGAVVVSLAILLGARLFSRAG